MNEQHSPSAKRTVMVWLAPSIVPALPLSSPRRDCQFPLRSLHPDVRRPHRQSSSQDRPNQSSLLHLHHHRLHHHLLQWAPAMVGHRNQMFVSLHHQGSSSFILPSQTDGVLLLLPGLGYAQSNGLVEPTHGIGVHWATPQAHPSMCHYWRHCQLLWSRSRWARLVISIYLH